MNAMLSSHIHEFCTLLAKAIYQSDPRLAEQRLLDLRLALLKQSRSLSSDEFTVIAGLDALYRTVRRNVDPNIFSLAACKGEDVSGFKVAIADEGEIVQMVRFARGDVAVSEAEKLFCTVAWPGSTVVLMAELEDGKILKCDHKRVGLKP